jgi:UDP-2-acetamido-2-deoxy-ribo-hexuluronate aminotransferase
LKLNKVIKEGKLKPKAIIPVDLFGLPARYRLIDKIAKKYNLKVIEDAAQSFGGSIRDKKVGTFGDVAATSFYPAKPLGCYGDGGAIFTNDDRFSRRM